MKLMIPLVVAMFCSACHQETERHIAASDRKLAAAERSVADLEERLGKVEADLAYNRTNYLAVLEELKSMATMLPLQSTNFFAELPVMIGDLISTSVKAEVERKAEEFRVASAVAAQRPVNVSAPTMKNGVPSAVYDRLAADAATKWPGNFRMQAYEIETQIESYQKLHGRR
jgi:hypothetical protein